MNPEPPVCVHHWVISTPDGPTSDGRCKKCGEERGFHNYYSAYEHAENPGDIIHHMLQNSKDWSGEYIPLRAMKNW